MRELTAESVTESLRISADRISRIGPWLAEAGVAFALVTYLGLRSGGYDEIVRGEIGIAAWWVLGLGVAIGALPRTRLRRGTWWLLGALLAFAAWTALGIGWSESAERSVAELGRVATLLGIFGLAVSLQGPGGLRRAVGGVAAGVVVVSSVALLSRLEPSWFPELEIPRHIPDSQARLHYPVGSWNGLAALTALGLPLLLALATSARQLAVRALALAAVPVLVLTAFFTLSRGGAVEAGLAVAVLLALHPRRLALVGSMVVAGAGSAILVALASAREELTDGLASGAAPGQGDEMLAATLIVCAAVAGLAVAISHVPGRGGIDVRIPRRLAVRGAVVAGALALVAAVAVGVPAALEDGWEDFKSADVPTPEAARFEAASGSGRYQWWETALDATAAEPLTGIGPGTFEYWWAREGTLPEFVRDAHSLYFETLAELGVIGLALILAVLAAPLAAGLGRGRRHADADAPILVAGALGGCVAFIVAAALEWAWELTVLPVCFLLLAAALTTAGGEAPAAPPSRRMRLGAPALAALGLLAIAIPLTGTAAVRESQERVREGDLAGGLGEARTASRIQPYAASPRVQEALVLELAGDLDGALAAARAATEKEATNWRTWYVLSRLEAKAGATGASADAYRKARSLNPAYLSSDDP